MTAVVSSTSTLTASTSSSALGGTPLHSPYIFSYMRRGRSPGSKADEGATAATANTSTSSETTSAPATEAASSTTTTAAAAAVNPYETSIKVITTVSTVEGFWETYDYLKRPNDLPNTTDYHFFRDGIKPTWEDPSNEKGGKWIVRLPKGLASRYWEEIILALIGGQFSGVPDGEICGAVVSVRFSEDIIGIWNRTSNDRDLIDRIRDAIKKVLQLPPQANMEYKPHQNSMQDRSSFRNTQVWKPKSFEGRSASGAGTGGTERSAAAAAGGTAISGGERSAGERSSNMETRRSNSWAEREERKPKGRDLNRAWR